MSVWDDAHSQTPLCTYRSYPVCCKQVFVRSDIVKNSGSVLARAVTIATRYAAVRRQTAPAPGARELQVKINISCDSCIPLSCIYPMICSNLQYI